MRDDREREAFADLLRALHERSGFEIFGWLLMDKVKKRDWCKRVIGRLIRKGTVMPVGSIAETLAMGHPNAAATLIRHDPAGPPWGKEWKEARRLSRKLERDEKFDWPQKFQPEIKTQLKL